MIKQLRAGSRTVVSTAIFVALAAATANAETFKMSHWVPPQHPFAKALGDWAKSIGKASNGAIKVSVFPAGQLGPASDHYDMAKTGIADATWVNPGFSPGRWPITSLAETILLIADPEKGSVALTKWYRKYAAVEMPGIHYCLTHTLLANTIFTVSKPVIVPADFKGMRIRPSGQMQARLIKDHGGTTVLMPYTKVREPLERGIIDGTFGGPFGLIVFGGSKKARYGIEAPISAANWVIPINRKKYDRLSSAHRKIVDAHCTPEHAAAIAGPASKWETAGWAKLKEAGIKLHRLNESQKNAWRTASEPLLAAWKAEVEKRGHDADRVHAELIDHMRREGALFQ